MSGDYNVQIAISQYGYATYLNLSNTQISVDRWGDNFEIEVETDGDDWSVEYPKFCNVETGSDDFEISFTKNTNYSRSGYLTVLIDNQRRTISYYQKGKCRYCKGKGEIACAWCSGLGKTMGNVDWYGNIQYVSCGSCGGDGAIECASCNGSGWE